MIITNIISILAAHFIADFPCQPDAWARGKSKSMVILSKHIAVYTLVLAALLVMCKFIGVVEIPSDLGAIYIVAWAGLNGGAHWIVDFFSSKATSYFFGKHDYHNGFVIVGLDQLLHYTCMIISWSVMFGS
jgi:hypothetical protein